MRVVFKACRCGRAGYTHNQLHIECLWELCLKPVVCLYGRAGCIHITSYILSVYELCLKPVVCLCGRAGCRHITSYISVGSVAELDVQPAGVLDQSRHSLLGHHRAHHRHDPQCPRPRDAHHKQQNGQSTRIWLSLRPRNQYLLDVISRVV